jgi:hypothetical protein
METKLRTKSSLNADCTWKRTYLWYNNKYWEELIRIEHNLKEINLSDLTLTSFILT